MTDEQNPKLMFNLTDTQLLVKIARGEIDAKELAKEQLANRGLDDNGEWFGF